MTRMFSLFAGAAVATLLALPMARAQTTTPTGTTSGATSNSMTNVYPTTVPTTASGQVATDPNGYSPYNTRATINNTGIPNQAPPLNLPSVYGLNPCSTGASVGITTPLVGIGGAVSSTDAGCEARNNAALAISAFKNELLAREMLCGKKEWREAWARIGKPCLEDQRDPKVASTASLPVASAQLVAAPSAVAAQAPISTPMGQMMRVAGPTAAPPVVNVADQPAAATMAIGKPKPDWCGNVAIIEWKTNAAIRSQCS